MKKVIDTIDSGIGRKTSVSTPVSKKIIDRVTDLTSNTKCAHEGWIDKFYTQDLG